MQKILTIFEIQDGAMAAAAILDFRKYRISDPRNRYWLAPGVCCSILVNIASSLRKVLTILEIQDGGRRHLGFYKLLHVWPKGSIMAGTWCLLLNFGENCLIHAENINNFRSPRWRPPPSCILQKFAYLAQGINIGWLQVFAVKFRLKLLNSCGKY